MTHPETPRPYVLDFAEITLADLGLIGGKNSSFGELFGALKPKGVGVLDGFATAADAYWCWVSTGGLDARLRSIFDGMDAEDLGQLSRAGHSARRTVQETPVPDDVRIAILATYERLSRMPSSRSGSWARASTRSL